MKQNDIIILLVSGFVAGVISFGLSTLIFGNPAERRETVKVVEPITTDFPELDDRFFNEEANNPTQLIRIEQNKNDENIFQQE